MGKMNARFEIAELPLSGLYLIRRKRIEDSRGFLERLFCAREMAGIGWQVPVAQINLTETAQSGTVRGMHYQHPPHTEKKLVMCLRGRVFDVAIDIRKGSPTFLKWHGEVLSPEEGTAMVLPEGLAHGFQTLTADVLMLYCHSNFYDPSSEAGIHPNDPAISILWPSEVNEISEKDRSRPFIDSSFEGISG
jgi:dTDP-4-dehydrorhamnose 3,5-epimerase